MSGSVEDEVVRMKFDNNAFERGVSTTLGTLAKLKNALTFGGSTKGLDDVEAKANKFNMSNINDQIDKSAHHWSAWKAAGLIAFGTIVHRAVNAGINMVKAFTVSPIIDGFKSYETQINAAKTIISNTGAKLPQVEAQLGQLQTYANQTVYSFSDMASNIGTFTAAGVKLVPAVSAIKGMGNTAALSGSSVQQLNTAMYQMSQAMSSGTIRLQDWNSLSNAGMGGQNVQKALMATASTIKGTGPQMDAAIKKFGNFRNSLTAGWLTGDVFSKTMGVMAGTIDKATGKTVAFSVAQLKAKGYTQAQAVQLNKLSQAAIESATQIRTYDQLTAALKEEVGTAYGAVFKTLFGNLNGATKLFTALHNVAENALTKPIYALNNFLIGIKKLGGISIFIDAVKLAFHELGTVLDVVKKAYRDVFPKQSSQHIVDLIKQFHVFIENLQPMPATLDKIRRIFAGVFALLDIGKQIVMGVFHVFGMLFGAMSHGSGGLTSFLAKIGDMVVAFDKALKQGDLLHNFFTVIGNLLTIPIRLFHVLAAAIGGVFAGFHAKKASGLTSTLHGLNGIMAKAAAFTSMLANGISGLQNKIGPGIAAIVHGFQRIGSAIASALGSQSFGNILRGLNTGLLVGIVVLLKKFFSNGLNIDVGHGFLGSAKEALEGVTGALQSMQQNLKAQALKNIAIAVGILALSVIGLSMIPSKKIVSSMTALAAGFAELLTSLAILAKIGGGSYKLPMLAASLILISTAILILTAAVAAMSFLSWQQIEKGLTVIGALLGGLVVVSYALSSNSLGLLAASVAITAIAVAMNLLYLAILGFSHMSWSAMLKGLAGIGMALAGVAIAMKLMPKGMVLQAAALVLISIALNGLYLAVSSFAKLSFGAMLKGLIGIAGALVAIALAMKLMPKGMVLQAAALVLVAHALQGIAQAVGVMGSMSWSGIAKGLSALALSLVILAGGLTLMEGSIGGAAAMLIVSTALRLLVPELVALGSMSLGEIVKSLLALAAAFAVIGLAGLVLGPVVPALLALGAALALVGVAMLAFGAGAALLGIGLTAVAAAGGAAIGILISGLRGIIALLPFLATNLAQALISFVSIIGDNAPAIIAAFVSLLNSLTTAVPKIMPGLIVALGSLIQGILTVLVQNAPRIIQAGLTLLLALIQGITNNIGRLVAAVANLIVSFLNAVASHIGAIVAAGLNLLVQFLRGLANGMGRVISAAATVVVSFLSGIGRAAGRIIAAGTTMIIHIVTGIGNAANRIVSAGVSTVIHFIRGLGSNAVRLANAAGQTILDFINGLTDAVNKYAPQIRSAGWNLAMALADGMTGGLASKAGSVIGAVRDIGGGLISQMGSLLGIGGPSRVFMGFGEGIGNGTIIGLGKVHAQVIDKVKAMGSNSVLAMKKTMAGLGDAISQDTIHHNPTITPILDLSQVKKEAYRIDGLVNPGPINAKLSAMKAQDISAMQHKQEAAAAAAASLPVQPPAPVLNFEQNNYSPKPIGTVDLYRQTNNQLSQAKKMLGLPAPIVATT